MGTAVAGQPSNNRIRTDPTAAAQPRHLDPGAHGLTARRLALDALLKVLRHRRPLDETFEAHPSLRLLEERDRAFAFSLAAAVLRHLGTIDQQIDSRLGRRLSERLPLVRGLLRLGAAQLLILGTPAHAAVHTSVALARDLGQSAHVPLINAVLRKLATEPQAVDVDQDAARLNTPGWLWHSWEDAYGEASTRDIARMHAVEPPLDLTPKRPEDAPRLAEALSATVLPTGTMRIAHAGPIARLTGYEAGEWWVQDAAAALPARLLGDVRGRAVLDLCAAPGGKTAQLAAAGAEVTAVDRSPKRLEVLRCNLQRLGLTAITVTADIATWRPSAPADRILLDAPCSGTGTIRRHPDIARLKTPEEVQRLAQVQRRLLAAGLDMLAPGGILVYCVCSLQPDEGPEVVDSQLATRLDVERMPIDPAECGGCGEFLTSAGDLRTLPCHLAQWGGLDGFYAARLRRRENRAGSSGA